MLKIAVFVSGRGSNLRAIQNSVNKSEINAEIKVVVSDKKKCEAFNFAESHKIHVYSVSTNSKLENLNYHDLLKIFDDLEINFVVLAGFLKKIPEKLIKKYPQKIINIHPALLPKYGGRGMYGMNVHRAVFDSSDKYSGATVHFVDEIYDNGLIIEQRKVDISNVKSAEEIAAKVLKVEHQLLPSVIEKFASKRISISNGKIKIIRK